VVFRNGRRDTPAARAQVADKLPTFSPSQKLYGSLCKQFRFGAGNHTVRGDVELERIEFRFAYQIRHRLVLGGAFDQTAQPIKAIFVDRLVELRV
jgi:hypothetical protein